jgi:hypothetical protein
VPVPPSGSTSELPGAASYRLTIASLTNTPIGPSGSGVSSPTIGSDLAGSSIARAISATAGRVASS